MGVWTVYERPIDYPLGFVARLHHVYNNGTHAPTLTAYFGSTLESVRKQLPPDLFNMGRQPEDDLKIVETWI
jgi:hypothetical protein